MKTLGMIFSVLLMLIPQLASANNIGGGSQHFINIAGFYQLPESKGDLPKLVAGDEAALLTALEGKAHYIFLSNSSGVMNDDVINIQNDLLRGKGDSAYEDYGVNCSFSVMVAGDEAHDAAEQGDEIQLTGNCNLFMVTHSGEQIKDNGVIKPTSVPDSDNVEDQKWKLIFHDKRGIAIYANAEGS